MEPGFPAGSDPATRTKAAVNSPAAPSESLGTQAPSHSSATRLLAWGTADARGRIPLQVGVGGTAAHTQTLPLLGFQKGAACFLTKTQFRKSKPDAPALKLRHVEGAVPACTPDTDTVENTEMGCSPGQSPALLWERPRFPASPQQKLTLLDTAESRSPRLCSGCGGRRSEVGETRSPRCPLPLDL